jgi:hypothetical protein
MNKRCVECVVIFCCAFNFLKEVKDLKQPLNPLKGTSNINNCLAPFRGLGASVML